MLGVENSKIPQAKSLKAIMNKILDDKDISYMDPVIVMSNRRLLDTILTVLTKIDQGED